MPDGSTKTAAALLGADGHKGQGFYGDQKLIDVDLAENTSATLYNYRFAIGPKERSAREKFRDFVVNYQILTTLPFMNDLKAAVPAIVAALSGDFEGAALLTTENTIQASIHKALDEQILSVPLGSWESRLVRGADDANGNPVFAYIWEVDKPKNNIVTPWIDEKTRLARPNGDSIVAQDKKYDYFAYRISVPGQIDEAEILERTKAR